MLFSELTRLLLQERHFSEDKVSGIWDEMCQRIIIVLLTLFHKFEVEGLVHRSF